MNTRYSCKITHTNQIRLFSWCEQMWLLKWSRCTLLLNDAIWTAKLLGIIWNLNVWISQNFTKFIDAIWLNCANSYLFNDRSLSIASAYLLNQLTDTESSILNPHWLHHQTVCEKEFDAFECEKNGPSECEEIWYRMWVPESKNDQFFFRKRN